MFDLHGRTALVTGAGQGIGAGIAAALSAQGAAVAVNDLVPDRAEAVAAGIAGAGGRAMAVPADVTDLDAVTRIVGDVESALGPVDVLVNNAGIPPGFVPTPFRDLPVAEWDKFIRLNLYGILYGTKAVVDGMCERGWGRIVTISSDAARVGLPSGIALYGAGKAGAVGFSRHLAMELQGSGVTVNCLTLGLMARDEHDARRPPRPTTRLGRPDDVGAAVCWLASNEAEWVTGQTIAVNGGVNTT